MNVTFLSLMDAFIPFQLAIPGLDLSKDVMATNILCLMNMVTAEELMDDEDYDGRKWGYCDIFNFTLLLCLTMPLCMFYSYIDQKL